MKETRQQALESAEYWGRDCIDDLEISRNCRRWGRTEEADDWASQARLAAIFAATCARLSGDYEDPDEEARRQ